MGQPRAKRSHLQLVPQPPLARDEQVRSAIELMLIDLGKAWTVTSLARRVGLSRPVFARRFVASTGDSPRKYLTRARMERAAELLIDTRWSLARVAALVGYASEFAFNRAFKRCHHVAPGTFRRTHAPTLSMSAAA